MKWWWVLCLSGQALWSGILDDRQIPLENNKANSLYEQQQYEEALKLYLDLYGQDTENGALAYNLANTYAALNDAEKAREFYQKAARSQHPEARQRASFNLGNLEMAANQVQQAVQQYVDYLTTNPEDVDAKRNLEIALRKLEEQQQNQQQQQQQDQQEQDENQEQQQQQSQDQQDNDRQESEDQQPQNRQQQDREHQDQDQKESNQQQKPEEEKQQPRQQPQEKDMNEAMKEQILQALEEQELQQQKEFQKRKIGRIKRRAKDW